MPIHAWMRLGLVLCVLVSASLPTEAARVFAGRPRIVAAQISLKPVLAPGAASASLLPGPSLSPSLSVSGPIQIGLAAPALISETAAISVSPAAAAVRFEEKVAALGSSVAEIRESKGVGAQSVSWSRFFDFGAKASAVSGTGISGSRLEAARGFEEQGRHESWSTPAADAVPDPKTSEAAAPGFAHRVFSDAAAKILSWYVDPLDIRVFLPKLAGERLPDRRFSLLRPLLRVILAAGRGAKTGRIRHRWSELVSGLIVRRLMARADWSDLDTERRTHEALAEGLERFGDPYTHFFDGSAWSRIADMQSGRFAGIGVIIFFDQEKKLLRIASTMPRSPAEYAGLLAGDEILAVDGQDISSELAAIGRMFGERSSEVSLTIRRPSQGPEPFTVSLRRRSIARKKVFSQMLPGGVGYLFMDGFHKGVGQDAFIELVRLRRMGMKSLIVDLRFNLGGNPGEAEEVAKSLLPKGRVIDSWKTRGERPRETRTAVDGTFSAIPLVVLTSRVTASAGEQLAAALQDNGRGPVIGERTWGKGVGMYFLPVHGGGGMSVTALRWFTPNGRSVHAEKMGEGDIRPDHPIAWELPDLQRRMGDLVRQLFENPPELSFEGDAAVKKALELLPVREGIGRQPDRAAG